MSGIETQKCIKPIFSDKSDKSKSKISGFVEFFQKYDIFGKFINGTLFKNKMCFLNFYKN
jgi:hypothetical protein